MRTVLPLFVSLGIVIFGSWWWLGSPVRVAAPSPSAKPYCVSYSPFHGQQTPLELSTHIDVSQIEEDLRQLAPLTDCVRTYSTEFGLDRVAEVASHHNMKVIQGAWLGLEAARNEREIGRAVGLAKQFPDTIVALVIGNETLLRGEISPASLSQVIRQVKAQVTIPVTYADVWEFWLRYREVSDAVDFVTIHVLPYWEDLPIAASRAGAHLQAIRRKVSAAFPTKEVLIGEVGWPSRGRMREGALPSPINQARVLMDVLSLADREGFRVNLIEAFDQPWKRHLEGTVGGHWGLLDDLTRRPKFTAGGWLSNHPFWVPQAALGVVSSWMVLAVAMVWLARKPPIKAPGAGRWIGACVCALVSGLLVGLLLEDVWTTSLGMSGWLRSILTAAIAILAPTLCAVAVLRGTVVPSFAQVLAKQREQSGELLALALGGLLAATCVGALESALGLVFDPRYRDFPCAWLTLAAVPFAVASVSSGRWGARPGTAEIVMAVVLAASAGYIALNESFANWQAVWTASMLVLIAGSLMSLQQAVPSSR